jgi:hypothetical protein
LSLGRAVELQTGRGRGIVSDAENAWHDQAVKPLRGLLSESEELVDLLEGMTPAEAGEVIQAVSRVRPLIEKLRMEMQEAKKRVANA